MPIHAAFMLSRLRQYRYQLQTWSNRVPVTAIGARAVRHRPVAVGCGCQGHRLSTACERHEYPQRRDEVTGRAIAIKHRRDADLQKAERFR